MNIFVLDEDIEKCAQYHCNKHVVKMILEYAQLLSTAHWMFSDNRPHGIYKPTHIHHPCALWVQSSSENYKWLHRLLFCLCEEYTFRYGKVHKVQHSGLLDALTIVPDKIQQGVMTSFAQAMPDLYKQDSAIHAYRSYYIHEKKELLVWRRRETPPWVILSSLQAGRISSTLLSNSSELVS